MGEGATKYNDGKPQMRLLDPLAQIGLVRVLEFGLKKYAAWNWQKGRPMVDFMDSIRRHALSIEQGELLDPESGLPHIDHIQANAMFISYFHHKGTQDYTNMAPDALQKIHALQSILDGRLNLVSSPTQPAFIGSDGVHANVLHEKRMADDYKEKFAVSDAVREAADRRRKWLDKNPAEGVYHKDSGEDI
jgi:hypothetical protein